MIVLSGNGNTSKLFHLYAGTASLLISLNLFAVFPSGVWTQEINQLQDSGPSNDTYSFTNRGYALENLRRYDAALEAYKQAVRISPRDSFLASYRDRLEKRLREKVDL